MRDEVFFVNNNYLGSIFMTRLVSLDVTKLHDYSFIHLWVICVDSIIVWCQPSMVIHLCI